MHRCRYNIQTVRCERTLHSFKVNSTIFSRNLLSLSTENPQKLAELQDLFLVEGDKYNVFPLDDRFTERGDVSNRPSFTAGRNNLVFYEGAVRLPEGVAPDVKNKSHSVTAEVTILIVLPLR